MPYKKHIGARSTVHVRVQKIPLPFQTSSCIIASMQARTSVTAFTHVAVSCPVLPHQNKPITKVTNPFFPPLRKTLNGSRSYWGSGSRSPASRRREGGCTPFHQLHHLSLNVLTLLIATPSSKTQPPCIHSTSSGGLNALMAKEDCTMQCQYRLGAHVTDLQIHSDPHCKEYFPR